MKKIHIKLNRWKQLSQLITHEAYISDTRETEMLLVLMGLQEEGALKIINGLWGSENNKWALKK